ncbi:MAG: hypothetical protein ACLT3Y_01520 [Ruminococcus callidus]
MRTGKNNRKRKTYRKISRDAEHAELEDGKEVQRDVVHHSGGVCVVPLTEKTLSCW